jgi:hypothetical protein
MIPVAKVDEPAGFDVKVRKTGQIWLTSTPGVRRPRPFLNAYIGALNKGFHGLCGYAAMLDPTGGTVDHYLSYKHHPNLAYEWTNYRFAAATLNSSKKNADDAVLDPFEVGAGWFEIILPSLQLCLTDRVPAGQRKKAEYTLKRLRLRDGEGVIRWRQTWYEMYQRGKLSLEGLREVAPLIAEAVEREMAKKPAPPVAPGT